MYRRHDCEVRHGLRWRGQTLPKLAMGGRVACSERLQEVWARDTFTCGWATIDWMQGLKSHWSCATSTCSSIQFCHHPSPIRWSRAFSVSFIRQCHHGFCPVSSAEHANTFIKQDEWDGLFPAASKPTQAHFVLTNDCSPLR